MIAQILNFEMQLVHWIEEMLHGQWTDVIDHFRFYVKFLQMKNLVACPAGKMESIIVTKCPMKNSGSALSKRDSILDG